MRHQKLLREIRARLDAAYGDRLKGVILYGSEAQENSTPESDIDVLVVLEGPVHQWREIHTCTQALYPLMLETGRIIDAAPVDVSDYEAAKAPLYVNARKEGVPL